MLYVDSAQYDNSTCDDCNVAYEVSSFWNICPNCGKTEASQERDIPYEDSKNYSYEVAGCTKYKISGGVIVEKKKTTAANEHTRKSTVRNIVEESLKNIMSVEMIEEIVSLYCDKIQPILSNKKDKRKGMIAVCTYIKCIEKRYLVDIDDILKMFNLKHKYFNEGISNIIYLESIGALNIPIYDDVTGILLEKYIKVMDLDMSHYSIILKLLDYIDDINCLNSYILSTKIKGVLYTYMVHHNFDTNRFNEICNISNTTLKKIYEICYADVARYINL